MVPLKLDVCFGLVKLKLVMTASPKLCRFGGKPALKLFPAPLPDEGDIGGFRSGSMNNSGNIQRLLATNYFTNRYNHLI
jgi:hypothetical protein